MRPWSLKSFWLPAQLGMTVAQWIPDAEFPAVAHTQTHTHTIPQLRHNPRLLRQRRLAAWETETLQTPKLIPPRLTSAQASQYSGYFQECVGGMMSPACGSHRGAQHRAPGAPGAPGHWVWSSIISSPTGCKQRQDQTCRGVAQQYKWLVNLLVLVGRKSMNWFQL